MMWAKMRKATKKLKKKTLRLYNERIMENSVEYSRVHVG